jgi:hypothetical protein
MFPPDKQTNTSCDELSLEAPSYGGMVHFALLAARTRYLKKFSKGVASLIKSTSASGPAPRA